MSTSISTLFPIYSKVQYQLRNVLEIEVAEETCWNLKFRSLFFFLYPEAELSKVSFSKLSLSCFVFQEKVGHLVPKYKSPIFL